MMMPTVACMSMTANGDPTRSGNRHALSAPFGVYAAKNGNFALAVLNDTQFATLAETIDAPALVEDPRFASDLKRRQHEPALACFIEQWAAEFPPSMVVQSLSQAGIPASEISNAMKVAPRSSEPSLRGIFWRQRKYESAVLPELQHCR